MTLVGYVGAKFALIVSIIPLCEGSGSFPPSTSHLTPHQELSGSPVQASFFGIVSPEMGQRFAWSTANVLSLNTLPRPSCVTRVILLHCFRNHLSLLLFFWSSPRRNSSHSADEALPGNLFASVLLLSRYGSLLFLPRVPAGLAKACPPRFGSTLHPAFNPNWETSKMKPYFHTSGGDNLLFESWAPKSPGAIGGASVAVFFLAMLDRLLSGLRGQLEGYWVSK
jgi:hypothetical protein